MVIVHQFAVLKENVSPCEGRHIRFVRNESDRDVLFFIEISEELHNLDAARTVKTARRFVSKQQLRLDDNRSGDCYAAVDRRRVLPAYGVPSKEPNAFERCSR